MRAVQRDGRLSGGTMSFTEDVVRPDIRDKRGALLVRVRAAAINVSTAQDGITIFLLEVQFGNDISIMLTFISPSTHATPL
jgi:hypothetical protein